MQSNTGSEEHLETPILQYAGGVIAAKLDRTEKELVHGVSFHISRGESLALIGETGSGKTLIAQSVMGVLPGNVRLVSGEVLFCGKALPKGKKLRSMLGREIVYIPQNGHEFLDPSRSIRRQMFDSIAKLGIAAPLREAFAREKLTQVGFTQPEAILDRYAFQLSGGMAHRVTIARSDLRHIRKKRDRKIHAGQGPLRHLPAGRRADSAGRSMSCFAECTL